MGEIVPCTFVPPSFFLGATIVQEKNGYNFPYGGKIRTQIGSFFPDFRIVLAGVQCVSCGGYNVRIWGYIRVRVRVRVVIWKIAKNAIHDFKELHLKVETCGELH